MVIGQGWAGRALSTVVAVLAGTSFAAPVSAAPVNAAPISAAPVSAASAGAFTTGATPTRVALALESGFGAGVLIEGLQLTVREEALDVTARSELRWPNNALHLGASGDVFGGLGQTPWRVGFRFLGGLTGEYGTMDDSDWISSRALEIPETKFSYTESDVVHRRSFLAQIELGLGIAPNVEVIWGYRHRYYTAAANGAEGWVLDSNASRVGVHVVGVRAASVRTHQLLPFLGLGWSPNLGRMALRTTARLMGLYLHSVDDHEFRNKLATATGGGIGAAVALRPSWQLTPHFNLGLHIEGEANWLLGGTVRQRFYGDDPSTYGEIESSATNVLDSDASHRAFDIYGGAWAGVTL